MQLATKSPGVEEAQENAELRRPAMHGGRLDFLDAIRGIAALSVAIQHVGERLFAPFASFTTHFFQFGQFGVMVFFLTSGFIIPHSIERSRTLRQFWVRRVLRLYPLYIFTMALAVVLYGLGHYNMMPSQFVHAPAVTILFNLTMLQDLLSRGNIIPLYWTLNFEMVFYFMITGLLLLGLLRRSIEWASSWLFMAILGALVLTQVLHSHTGNGLFFNFATMFVGTVIYRWHQGRIGWKQAGAVLCLGVCAIVVVNWAYFYQHPDPSYLGARSFVPMTTAWIGAYAVFVGAFLLRSRSVPRILTYLGAISYSVYLMQTFVLVLGPKVGNSGTTAILWLALIIALSSLTYRYIEAPAIALGRRATRKAEVPPVLVPMPANG